MNLFSIALLQLQPTTTLQESLNKGLEACNKAKSAGADLALFPELWSIGYDIERMTPEHALSQEDPYIQAFSACAQQLDMAIALTYLAKTDSKPTNRIMLIDRTGTPVLTYDKVHTCSFEGGSETTLQPGTQYKAVSLLYEKGTINVGAMICFDREFPDAAHALAAQGAELILVPNACLLSSDPALGDVRLAQIRSRAFENKVALAVTNYPAPKNDGASTICFVNGQLTAQAGMQETILVASINRDAVRTWQKNEPWGPKN